MQELAPLIEGQPSPASLKLAEAYWPGPLTMIFPKSDKVPLRTTGGLNTVAVRMPSHPIIRELIEKSGRPIAAPSGNRSGRPSPTSAAHMFEDMDGRIPLILDGGECAVGVESTVVDMTGDIPRILRPGAVTQEMIAEICGACKLDHAILRPLKENEKPRSPGMKYRHYAPSEPVVIVSGSRETAAAYIHRHFVPGDRVLCFQEELPLYEGCGPLAYGEEADVNTLSAGLFAALRELDDPAIHQVYARCPEGGGVAYAVQNRLKKAAAFHIVNAEEEV